MNFWAKSAWGQPFHPRKGRPAARTVSGVRVWYFASVCLVSENSRKTVPPACANWFLKERSLHISFANLHNSSKSESFSLYCCKFAAYKSIFYWNTDALKIKVPESFWPCCRPKHGVTMTNTETKWLCRKKPRTSSPIIINFPRSVYHFMALLLNLTIEKQTYWQRRVLWLLLSISNWHSMRECVP